MVSGRSDMLCVRSRRGMGLKMMLSENAKAVVAGLLWGLVAAAFVIVAWPLAHAILEFTAQLVRALLA